MLEALAGKPAEVEARRADIIPAPARTARPLLGPVEGSAAAELLLPLPPPLPIGPGPPGTDGAWHACPPPTAPPPIPLALPAAALRVAALWVPPGNLGADRSFRGFAASGLGFTAP